MDKLKLGGELVETLLNLLKLPFPAVLLRERSDWPLPLLPLGREVNDCEIPVNWLFPRFGHVPSLDPGLDRFGGRRARALRLRQRGYEPFPKGHALMAVDSLHGDEFAEDEVQELV